MSAAALRRLYEWRDKNGAASGRALAENACAFRMHGRRAGLVAPGVVGEHAKDPMYVHVVATGERVESETDGIYARLSPDMPWFDANGQGRP